MAEKKKYNSILISGRKDQTLTYSKYVKDEESGESVKESLDKKVNVTDKLETQQIKDGAITNEKMAADSVGNTNLQDGSVSNEKLEDGSITNEKLAENSITKDKLQDKTIGVEKLDNELRQAIAAATGLPEDLVETIQNVDDTLKDHQSQLDDKQSQIDDKQQQITANDEDISLLQTRSTQMEETIKSIAATGGASQATAVTYNNEKSKLTAVNIQSAVDEVVDKTAIKEEEGTLVETPFRYIQNEEFIFAKVDAEDKLLFGIQWDGTPKFGKTSAVEDRLQSQVTLLAERVAIIMGDEDTTNVIDTMNELKKFFAEIENTETLTGILANLDNVAKNLDKTTIKDEEGNVQDTPFRVIENEEFIMAVVDSEDRVLYGIYRDTGKPYYPQNDMYHISQSEEFLWVILDAANHPLLGIQQDGTCWAAKAKWLDDIKAIKEALSIIDETLKTFQTKEDGKGLINLDVADSFFYISNDEYIIAVVDAENRILAGIKYDGEPYFPNHEMYSVITNEEWLYAIIDAEDRVLGGFRANDGHMVVGGIDISIFIANAIIDIADIKERTAHLSTIVNDEYLSVETDVEGKVIGYIAPDGSHYFYKVKSETIPTEFEHIEDPEGRTEITTDAEGKVLSYRDAKGTKFEKNFKTDHLDLSDDGMTDFVKALNDSGFKLESSCDWSNYVSNNGVNPLHLPIPQCAIINISNESHNAIWPVTKSNDYEYYMEYHDMLGNYFKKNIIMNAQGNSSMVMIKKNGAIDIFDSSVYDNKGKKGKGNTFGIKFGNWVTQDSFHLKAFYNDFFKGCSFVAYQIANEVMMSYGITKDRPWKRALIGDYIGTGQEGKSINDISLQIDDGARCMPDGFPCIVYLNGDFYGIYTFALKKHRDNYHMKKKDGNHIHLDGTNLDFFNGKIDWSGFEVRNPKDSEMCCTVLKEGTTEYLPYSEGKELLGDDAEHYNPANKSHVLSNKVKRSIEKLSKRCQETNALSSNEEKKLYLAKYFDVDSILDYILVATAVHDTDGGYANYQWITYDGEKWFVCNYDKDRSFGNGTEYMEQAITTGSWIYQNVTIFKLFEDLFSTELKEKWNGYVKKGIFTYDNFIGKISQWVQRIGQDNYKKEYSKWKQAPCNRDDNVNRDYWKTKCRADQWYWWQSFKAGDFCFSQENEYKVYKALKSSNNVAVTNTEYWQDVTYSPETNYNVGDICGYGFHFGESFYTDNGFYVFEAIAESNNTPPISKIYDEYPHVMGYRDNIWRVSNYIKQTLNVLQKYIDSL